MDENYHMAWYAVDTILQGECVAEHRRSQAMIFWNANSLQVPRWSSILCVSVCNLGSGSTPAYRTILALDISVNRHKWTNSHDVARYKKRTEMLWRKKVEMEKLPWRLLCKTCAPKSLCALWLVSDINLYGYSITTKGSQRHSQKGNLGKSLMTVSSKTKMVFMMCLS